MSRLRFGIIGAGAIARAYVQAIERAPDAELRMVADVDPARATGLAGEAGCKALVGHQALLDEAACDVVVVSTPPAHHPEITIDCLGVGVHVLCEKPLAIDSASARAMIEAAEASGALLTMGSKFRFVEDVIQARSIVESGILGEIVLFENAFCSRVDMSSRWNSEPELSGGGVLIDNGTHSVDLMRYFLGPIARVQGVEGKRIQTTRVEDTVQLFVESRSGVMGHIDLSWSLDKELGSFLDIYGSQGTIRVGWRESKYRQSSSPDWVVFGVGYDKLAAFQAQVENLCRAIRGEEALGVTAVDGIASVEVVEAAYESMRRNDWIAVNHVEPPASPVGVRLAGSRRV